MVFKKLKLIKFSKFLTTVMNDCRAAKLPRAANNARYRTEVGTIAALQNGFVKVAY